MDTPTVLEDWEVSVKRALDSLNAIFGDVDNAPSRFAKAYVDLETASKLLSKVGRGSDSMKGLMSMCLAFMSRFKEAKSMAEKVLALDSYDPGANLALLCMKIEQIDNPTLAGNVISGIGQGYSNVGNSSSNAEDSAIGCFLGLLFGGIGMATNAASYAVRKNAVSEAFLNSANALSIKICDGNYYPDIGFNFFVLDVLIAYIRTTGSLKLKNKETFEVLRKLQWEKLNGYENINIEGIMTIIRQAEVETGG